MTLRSLCTLALAGSLTSSCIYYTDPVPEMPYRPYKQSTATNTQTMMSAAQAEALWYTTTPTATMQASIPDPYMGATPTTTSYTLGTTPAPAAATAVIPAPTAAPTATTPAPATTTAITQPALKLNPVITPATATPAPAETKPVITLKPATPATQTAASSNASTAASAKEITNDGPIPVATPVPGDPTRVYNPLDSSKTIRITDKNGKVYPSGKELKVRGTNFHFYVP